MDNTAMIPDFTMRAFEGTAEPIPEAEVETWARMNRAAMEPMLEISISRVRTWEAGP